MNGRVSQRLGIAGAALLALGAPALGQTGAAAPGDAVNGTEPTEFHSIVRDAFPISGVRPQPARPIQGLVRPRFPASSRRPGRATRVWTRAPPSGSAGCAMP
jgi:hypothetical protein